MKNGEEGGGAGRGGGEKEGRSEEEKNEQAGSNCKQCTILELFCWSYAMIGRRRYRKGAPSAACA